MTHECMDYPPSMGEHLWGAKSNLYDHEEQQKLADRPPFIYIAFLVTGAVMIAVQSWAVLPRVWNLHRAGLALQSERKGILYPPGIRSAMLIVAMPWVTSVFRWVTLLVPLWAWQCDFFVRLFESLCLYLFSKLLTKYNDNVGSMDALWLVLQKEETHHCTARPLCVCFECCRKGAVCFRDDNEYYDGCGCAIRWANRRVTKKDIRWIDTCIVQFPVLVPIIGFSTFQRNVEREDDHTLIFTRVTLLLSTVVCITALHSLSILVTQFGLMQNHSRIKDSNVTSDGFIGVPLMSERADSPQALRMFDHSSPEQHNDRMQRGSNPNNIQDPSNIDNVASKMRAMGWVLLTSLVPVVIINTVGVDELSGLRGRAYSRKVMTQAYGALAAIVCSTLPCIWQSSLYRTEDSIRQAKGSLDLMIPDKASALSVLHSL